MKTEEAYRKLLSLMLQTSMEEDILQGGLDTVTRLLHATYGAIGIFGKHGELEKFLYAGLTHEQAAKIGPMPLGRGLLGHHLQPDQVLRVNDIGKDPRFGGFPVHHPHMKRLIMCPIAYQSTVFGHMYLCDKINGKPFTKEDDLLVLGFSQSLGLVTAYRRAKAEREQAIQEQSLIEARLRQKQKLEALGRLAGGVAHDFNNILAAILASCDLAHRRLHHREDVKRLLSEIQKSSKRAANLVQQLLAFSRAQPMEPQVLDLNQVISSLVPMFQCVMGDDVGLSLELEPHLLPVKIDQGQIEQVLMNLLVNARDAMPAGGALRIQTTNRPVKASADAPPDFLPTADEVLLQVTDTGMGISEDIRSKIFEPFFTTKSQGKGTGLGLSTVYGIVVQAGGAISVASCVGQGTTFAIALPSCQEKPGRPSVESLMVATPGQKSTTILLVEDDGAVRELIREILKEHGFHVLEAPNAQSALNVGHSFQSPIHLVLSDVVLPDQSGTELVCRLQSLRPNMKALCMSGYPKVVGERHDLRPFSQEEPFPFPFIPKPFKAEELTQRIREILNQSQEKPNE